MNGPGYIAVANSAQGPGSVLNLDEHDKAKAKAQVLGIAPLNMRSTCQRRFTIVEVVTD